MGLFISLICTIFVYLTVPFCVCVTGDGFDAKKAKKWALVNSICGWFLFTMVYMALEIDVVASFPPAVLYYFLAKSMMTSTAEKERIKKERELKKKQ